VIEGVATVDSARPTGGLTADDRLDIHELYSLFAKALDAGDVEEMLSLFTDGATLLGPWGTFTGRDEIQRALTAMTEQARGTHHLVYSPTIAREGGITKGHANFLQLSVNGGDLLAGRGSFSDRFSNVGGRWRFLSRELEQPDAIRLDQMDGDEDAFAGSSRVILAAAAGGPVAQFLAEGGATPPAV
jgi:ketosteroid isomerase-like protein